MPVEGKEQEGTAREGGTVPKDSSPAFVSHQGAAHRLHQPHCGSTQSCPLRRAQLPTLHWENHPAVIKHLLLRSTTSN